MQRAAGEPQPRHNLSDVQKRLSNAKGSVDADPAAEPALQPAHPGAKSRPDDHRAADAGAGIGANTAIFTVDYATLLAPLPYPRPNELVMIGAICEPVILVFSGSPVATPGPAPRVKGRGCGRTCVS